MDGDSWHCTRGSSQDHPQEKEKQEAKWLPEEAFQIAKERREAKGKEEMERYTHLNAEFQRIAKRDKKAFLSGECREIEETIEWDLLKKIRDTMGTFHAKMDTIKDEMVWT